MEQPNPDQLLADQQNNNAIREEIQAIQNKVKVLARACQDQPLLAKPLFDDLCKFICTLTFDGVDPDQWNRFWTMVSRDDLSGVQRLQSTCTTDTTLIRSVINFMDTHKHCTYILSRGQRAGECCGKNVSYGNALQADHFMDNYILLYLSLFKKYNTYINDLYIPGLCSSHNQPHHSTSAINHLVDIGKKMVKQSIQNLCTDSVFLEQFRKWKEDYALSDDFLNGLFTEDITHRSNC